MMIRPAEPRDVPAITRIYAHAVRYGTASFELEPPDEAEIGQRHRALVDGGFPYLVAEIDGVIAGYAYAGPYRARPAYRFTVEDSIYIAPDMQRRGIGRALLDRLLIESEARGFRQMIAVIGDFGADALDRAARGGRLPHGWQLRGSRLQIRPLARHRADAEGDGHRRTDAAVAAPHLRQGSPAIVTATAC